MQEIDVSLLKEWRDQGRAFRLVDVREKEEWDLVHLEASEWIPLSKFQEEAPRLLQPGEAIALLCHHGIRSFHAAKYLESLGFRDLYNIRGGIDAWAKCVDRTLATY